MPTHQNIANWGRHHFSALPGEIVAAISRAFLKGRTLLVSQGPYSTIGACHFGQAIMAALLDEEAANAAQRDGNMNARPEETDSRFLHRAVRKFY